MTDPTMQHPASAATFDEIEAQMGAQAQSTNLDTKLSGEGVPDELKDKSIKDLVTLVVNSREALKMSEDARKELGGRVGTLEARVAASEVAGGARPPVPPSEPTEVTLTDEELKKLHEEDPLKAIQYMMTQASKSVEKNLSARLGPLAEGNAAAAESRAKERYKLEFELFKGDIDAILNKVPDRSVMGTDKAWDDLLAYVSGQPKNREVLFKKQIDAALEAREREAHASAETTTGANLTAGAQRTPAATKTSGLDSLEMEIADKLGMAHDEYARWKLQ